MISSMDASIILWLNELAQVSRHLDQLVYLVSKSYLLKGVAVAALLWHAWLQRQSRLVTEDLFWPRTAGGIVLAVLIARGLQNLLPARLRPLQDAALGFRLPLGLPEEALEGWSSFPSDHAVLFAALVTAIFLIDRRAGWLAAGWSLVVVLLPRLYLGFHYPSDIAAGALLGTVIMLAAHRVPLRRGWAPVLMRLENAYRGLSFTGFFVFTFLVATLFDDLRAFLKVVPAALRMMGS